MCILVLSIFLIFNLIISQTTNAQESTVCTKQIQHNVFAINDADVLSPLNDSTRVSIKMNYTPVIALGILGFLGGALIGGKINSSNNDTEFDPFPVGVRNGILIGAGTGIIGGYFFAKKDVKHKQKKMQKKLDKGGKEQK